MGQTANTLSVVANGTGLTYQWYSNTLNSNSGGTLLVGATSMNYTPITTSAGTLYYYVVVSGTCTPAVTSAVSGSVLVNTAPAITVQPSTTGETICQNSPATQLSVTATGAGLSYQWYRNTTNSNTGGTAVGTNTNTYTPATTTAGTFYYYVIVSGTCPPPATSAISGAIIVNAPPAITGQPSTTNQTACQNIPATTLNVVANGAGLMYQWYSNAVNSNTGGTAISGANNANYTPSTTTIGLLYYYVVVSGTCAPPIASAVSVSVTVLAPPAISIQPSITPASYCLNATATSLSVTASGFTITYQWYRNSTNSNSGGTAIGGATSATYIPPTNSTGVSYYYVVVTGGCAPPITSNVSGAIQIDPLSVGGTLSIQNATTPPNVVTLCPNVGTSIINLAGNTGTVTWEKSIDGGASWIPATGTATQTSLTVSNLAQTTIYRAVVKSGACSITYSTNAVVSVIPPFTPNPVIATPSAICIGDTAVLSAGTGFNQWGTAVDGTFNNANPLGWQVKINGVLQGNFPANGNNTSISEWSESNPKTFNGVAYDNSNVPGTGKFAVCLGTINTTMESPVFTLVGMPTAVLTFWQAGTFLSGTTGAVEISIDGGASYLPLAQYSNANPPPGNPNGGWASTTLNLNNYLGQNNVRIRWNYSGTAGSVWAVDAITLPSAPPIVTYVWTPTTAVIGSSTTSPISVSPAVTTTYTINSTVGGCANASSVPVTVTVNPRADITPSGISPTVCASTVAQTASISYSNAINGANTYSIRWRATPVNSFALVNNATLSGGIINITVPANTSPGSYAGYLTVSNSSTGCSATGDSIYIIVNARPTATLNGTTAICLGGSATITIPVTGPGTITGQLSGGINFSGTAPSITVTVSPAVTTIYTITSLTNGTCASLATDYSGTYTVNIVTPATISAQPISTDACLGSSVVLSSAANNIAVGGGYQWQVRTTPSGTWADISNGAQYSGVITANLTVNSVSIAMIDYDYRVKVNSGTPCNLLLNSDSAKIMIKNVWTGGTSIDWMTGSNWSNGAPPTLACDDTYILGNRSFQPTLTSGTGTVKNLIVAAGAYLTVNGTGILGVAGLITNAGTVDLLAGTLLLNGTTSQIIEGPVFKEKTIFRLTLNNNVNVIGNDTLKISHAIGFAPEANGKTFNASTKNVSLLSTLNYTANVNEIKNGNSILGNNFTVERYISTGTVHGQTWQLLSTAITGQSIFNSWQESGIYKPGLGTRITSPLYNGSNGFDATSLRDAIKVYNPNIDEFDGVTSTLNNLANPKGYYIFIRGDRNVFSAANAANPTTLRSTGTLNIGNSLPVVAVQAGKYESIGNPYPSTFDLRKFYTDHSALLTFDVYVWDATLGGLYGVGGYRTLTYLAGDYYAVPAGGFYSSISNLIQSGQAFFIRSKGPAGAINFKESYKEDTSMLASRTQSHANIPTIQTTLKGANAGAPQILLDGALAVFGDDYSNDVNFDDANKFINVGINTGFVRSGKILAVERRQLPTAADTMHLNFSGAKQLSYTWSINIQNLEDAGVDVWLWDKFLNSRTSLVINGNTNINFGVDNTAASIAPDRFKIIFKKVILPVRLIGITAIRKNDNTVSVNWKVENEINVTNYTLERSADGIIFNSLSVKEPLYNNGAQADYSYQDASPLFTDCYYRIKAVSQSGLIQYSAKVKVEALNLPPSISVYPIPVINKEMNLLFVNKAKGRYNIQITNNLGQIVYNGEVVVATVMENKKISLVNLKTEGIYQLAIKAQDGSTNKLQQILVK